MPGFKEVSEMKQGEITAYLSLVFILLTAFVGSVMESASIQIAKNYRRADMNRALECVFAEYQKDLLEEYDIFALDVSYESGSYQEEQMTDRLNYYGAANLEQKILRIQYLTDDGCQAFFEQVAAYMEHKYGLDKAQDMLGKTDVWEKQQEDSERYQEDAQEKEAGLEDLLTENEGELPAEDNPISHVGELKASPILAQVTPREMQISDKKINLSDTVSRRQLNKGRGDFSDVAEETGTLSMLLFGEYVLEHFQTAADEKGTDALDYQVEYILEGKASDRENLEAVAGKLLLLRFVPNYVYLQSDSAKKAEAEALAATLCTLLALPEVTEAAAQVILLAWAYGESVVDVRSLLSGNRVAVVKSETTWQLQLSGLLKLGTGEDTSEGMDAEGGLKYQDYIRMLLFLEKKENAGLRSLDLIEQNLRKAKGQKYFRADFCVSKVEYSSTCTLRRGIRYKFPTYFGYR